MAKETIVRLVDDLDGSEAVESVSFAYKGHSYEIDLNEKNAAALEKALSKFVNAARKGGSAAAPRGRSRRSARSASAAPELGAIREWATQNGFEVSTRGRIASAVVEAYEAAH